MGFMNWLTGRDTKESDLYVDFDKVESVTTRLNEISTSSVSEGFQSITNALEKLNSTPGMDLIGGANPSFSVAEVFESISSEIEQISTSIQTKADDAKVYSEASDLERVGSSAAMILAKAGEGFLSVFEDIGDGVVSVIGWLAPKDSGLEKACEEFVKKDLAHDTFSFYYDSEFAKKSAITEDSFISKAAKFGGQMGGFILLGAGISKATKVFAASTNPLLQSTAQFASSLKKIGTAEAALMGMGTGTEEALQKGKTMNQAALKGLGRAAIQGAIAWGVGTLAEKAALRKTKASEVFANQGDDTLRAMGEQLDDGASSAMRDSRGFYDGLDDQLDDELVAISKDSKGVFVSKDGTKFYRGTDIGEQMVYTTESGETYYLSSTVNGKTVTGAAKHIVDDVNGSTTKIYNNATARDILKKAYDLTGDVSFQKNAEKLTDDMIIGVSGKKVPNPALSKSIKKALGVIRENYSDDMISQLDDVLCSKTINAEKIGKLASQSGLEFPNPDLLSKTGVLSPSEIQEVESYTAKASKQIFGRALENFDKGLIVVDGKTVQATGDLMGLPLQANGAVDGADPYLVEIITRPTHTREVGNLTLKHFSNQVDKNFPNGISIPKAIEKQAQRAIDISIGDGKFNIMGEVVSQTPSAGETSGEFLRRTADGIIRHITSPQGELYIRDTNYQQSAIQYIQEKIFGTAADQTLIQKLLSFIS